MVSIDFQDLHHVSLNKKYGDNLKTKQVSTMLKQRKTNTKICKNKKKCQKQKKFKDEQNLNSVKDNIKNKTNKESARSSSKSYRNFKYTSLQSSQSNSTCGNKSLKSYKTGTSFLMTKSFEDDKKNSIEGKKKLVIPNDKF